MTLKVMPSYHFVTIGDHARYLATYLKPYPGYYFTGDAVYRDQDGFYFITGRVDDVINVSGHRIGTAEVESALVKHPSVAQAAVVSRPHPIKGKHFQYIACHTNAQHSKIISFVILLYQRRGNHCLCYTY